MSVWYSNRKQKGSFTTNSVTTNNQRKNITVINGYKYNNAFAINYYFRNTLE